MNPMRLQLIHDKIFILFICIITFIVNNQVIIPDIMESRNIVTAREMVYDGNWMIPTLNGELRLEKPPLPTWLTAVAEVVSPDSLFLQRTMAGLAAILLVFYFYYFTRFLPGIHYIAAIMLFCTIYNVILLGRTASLASYWHSFMLSVIYFLAK